MSVLVLWLVEPQVATPSKFALFFLFGVIITFGMLLNMFVIYRMRRLSRGDREQFINGTGVYLFVMALVDIISLMSIFTQLLINLSRDSIDENALAALCKISEFVSRCAYTQSMYCWLFMSGLRYLAALHPLMYSTIWRSPHTALGCVAAVSITLNLHIFVSFFGDTNHGCVMEVNMMSSVYNVVDLMLSFCIPFTLIFCMDLRVLCCRTHRRSSDPVLQIVFHRTDEETEKRKAANMKRFMIITLISLVLSFPENILRASRVLIPDVVDPLLSYRIFDIVKTLYFAKFSFNAFYLTSYVFDRNVLSKTSSSRQLSLSIRRLEENPSIIERRERSNTVSYRVTTPVPVLTRNSSCILLEQGTIDKMNWV